MSAKKKKTHNSSEILEAVDSIITPLQIGAALADGITKSEPGSREQFQAISAYQKLRVDYEKKHPEITDADLRDMSDEELVKETLAGMGAPLPKPTESTPPTDQ